MNLPINSIIASGPVIIENNKVLLNKEQKKDYITPWMFPGGEVEDFDSSLEEACKREVGEEMGIEVDIIEPLRTIMLKKDDRVIFLVHYLAKRIGEITKGDNVVEYDWHDINNLPEDCAENVKTIIADYLKK
jgi:ADP-ribose pyrophosphatase YjhB (NUDIX family)